VRYAFMCFSNFGTVRSIQTIVTFLLGGILWVNNIFQCAKAQKSVAHGVDHPHHPLSLHT